VIVTSGSDFRPNTPGGAYNFLEPYLRAVLGFIGITQVQFVYAHSLGSDALAAGALAEASTRLAELARAA
jgi:FMN-dependent NADH-azoreductase